MHDDFARHDRARCDADADRVRPGLDSGRPDRFLAGHNTPIDGPPEERRNVPSRPLRAGLCRRVQHPRLHVMAQRRRSRLQTTRSRRSIRPDGEPTSGQAPLSRAEAWRPAWWATSAVPYRWFWLLPSAGVPIGLGAASVFSVPVWLGFICAELPALGLE